LFAAQRRKRSNLLTDQVDGLLDDQNELLDD
jgi:hypothetical protein